MTSSEHDFFYILNAGLGREVALESVLTEGEIDWKGIYELASEQTVTGIIADGINALNIQEQVPSQILQQFLFDTGHITKSNIQMNEVQTRICSLLEDNNLRYVVLKGQGVALNYPNPLSRISGDIDLYLEPSEYERAKILLTEIGNNPTDKPLAGEFAITINNVQVELHNNIYAGVNNHCVRLFPELTHNLLNEARNTGTYYVPSVNFDAIYLFIHTVRHLGSFGISLRQVIDWTMHVEHNRNEIDWQWVNETIDRLHLSNLWTLFSGFAKEYLGSDGKWLGSEIENNTSRHEELWQLIESSGNFGCSSEYKNKRFRLRVSERLYRTFFLLRQADTIKRLDPEFGNYLRKRELKGFFSSLTRAIH